MYAALASQKNHMAVYLMCVYAKEETRINFEEAYKKTGKKMDMGKRCVRFKKLENLPLELIGKEIASIDMETYIKTTKEIFNAQKK